VRVVDKFIAQLEAQLTEKNVALVLSEEARQWLAKRGYDPAMGARPLGRVIQEHVKKPLAEEILFGDLAEGGTATIKVKDDRIVFDIDPQKKAPKSKPATKETVER